MSHELTTPVVSPRRAKPVRPTVLSFEPLEERKLFSTFNVTSDQDAGAGTLRQAIELANANPGADRITFSIGAGGLASITPNTPLPDINDTLEIDGTTQPPPLDGPSIELSGQDLAEGNGDDGLRFVAGSQGSVVKGLFINRFDGFGIEINGTSNVTVAGNSIGATVDGTGSFIKPQTVGVAVLNSANNTIGGLTAADRNLISGNDIGIGIDGAASFGNVVVGNFVGTTANGKDVIGNLGVGVELNNGAAHNTIGGATAAARNVISANGGAGVALLAGSTENLVQGNFIGTDVDGAAALGNGDQGVAIVNGSTANTFADNVISGNAQQGVVIVDSDANVLTGNRIGTTADGTLKLPNGGTGVSIAAADDTVIGGTETGAGNVISGNADHGVGVLQSSRTVIQGNHIGVDANGFFGLGNGVTGVLLIDSDDVAIGGVEAGAGNVISANTLDGIRIDASERTVVQGNLIGTNAGGSAAVKNFANGIGVNASTDTVIGGAAQGAGNLVSGNHLDGIVIVASPRTAIQGNKVGTEVTGTFAMGNGGDGIDLRASSEVCIGGSAAGEGNLISGNGNDGIEINGFSENNQIKGNFIGTNAAGTGRLGNGSDGIFVFGANAASNIIGGTDPGDGNVISGNGAAGVALVQSGPFNRIQGNKIGTDAAGVLDLGNTLAGVLVSDAPSNLVGGSVPEAGNLIAFNDGSGVVVSIGNNNTVRLNSLFSNAGIGIDLNGDGVTPNDAGDADTLANNRQNFPVLTSASSSNGHIALQGAINSTPNKVLVLDFYANTEIDGIGGSEGRTHVGSATVTTDANGNGSFSATFAKAVAAGQFVTATASTIDGDPFVDTSEFSSPVKVLAKPTLSIGDVTLTEGKKGQKAFTFTVTLSAPSPASVNVSYATEDGTATKAGKDYTAKSGTITFNPGETTKTVTILVTGDAKKEAGETFFVNLSSPVNADIVDAQAVGFITNDD